MNRKKMIAIMLVMMLVGVVCLFAEYSNKLEGVYILYNPNGQFIIKNENNYAIRVSYTIYCSNGSRRKASRVWCEGSTYGRAGQSSTITIREGIKAIEITFVEKDGY